MKSLRTCHFFKAHDRISFTEILILIKPRTKMKTKSNRTFLSHIKKVKGGFQVSKIWQQLFRTTRSDSEDQ
jgi:hypothetical protein